MSGSNLTIYFVEHHPREAALVLSSYSAEEIQEFLNQLPEKLIISLIRYLYPDLAVTCLIEMSSEQSAIILEQLGVDDAAKLLSRMKIKNQNKILASMSMVMSNRMTTVLRYPVGTIGHYMSPGVFIVLEDMPVSEVIHSAKNTNNEVLADIFIVNDQNILVGVVDMKDLMFADPDDTAQQLMKVPDIVLNVRSYIDHIKDNPRWRYKEALPVKDQKNAFVGVLKRSKLNDEVSNEKITTENNLDLMESVIEIADLFWEVCFSFMQPSERSSTKGTKND